MARIDEIQEAPPQRSKFMEYFSKASNIVINGGQFIMDNRKFITVKPLKPKFDKRHGIETLDVQNIDLDGEIIGVRTGTGLQRGILLRTGEAIVVRTFEGEDARQARDRYIKESIGIFHSNHLNIVGISSKRSPHSFVVYQGGVESGAAAKIASFLLEGINESLAAIYDLLADVVRAVIHLQRFPLILSGLSISNFDVVVSSSGRAKISLVATSQRKQFWYQRITSLLDWSQEESLTHRLCLKVLTHASHMLHADEVNISAGRMINFISAVRTEVGAPQLSALKSRLPHTARRSIVWIGHKYAGTPLRDLVLPLENAAKELRSGVSINRFHFEQHPPGHPFAVHSCASYYRETVVISPWLSDAAILAHFTPAKHERCTVCHKIVTQKQNLGLPPLKLWSSLPRHLGFSISTSYYNPPCSLDAAEEHPFGNISHAEEEYAWDCHVKGKLWEAGRIDFEEYNDALSKAPVYAW